MHYLDASLWRINFALEVFLDRLEYESKMPLFDTVIGILTLVSKLYVIIYI